jgi:hypothetical protein
MTKIFNRCTGQTYLVSNSYVPKTDCEVIILDEVDVMPKEKKSFPWWLIIVGGLTLM